MFTGTPIQNLVSLLLIVYWIVVVVAIVSQDRDPTDTIAWILVLLLFPIFGLVFYFFAGRDWKGWLQAQPHVQAWLKKRLEFMNVIYGRYADYNKQQLEALDQTPAAYISKAIAGTFNGTILPAHSFDIWASGGEYFPVLLEDLKKAQKTIQIQYFIWEYDELTAKFTEILLDRLAAGVEVYMLNDYMGSFVYKKTETKKLEAAGAKVAWDMTQIGRLNYRNHRKITVIDGVVGHSGGVNIGQEYIDGKPKYNAWRDTGIRVTGPIVCEYAKLFADRWMEVKNESLLQDRFFGAGVEGLREGALPCQVVAHGVEDPWESARRAHDIAISRAKKRVWLQSPYFIPDPATYDALCNAALSGVDVRLMMTDVPDTPAALRAAESYYKQFILSGGHVLRWTPGFFHAKSITIDGNTSAVGTLNLDIRSLKLHKEMMTWVYDEGVAKRMEEIFLADQKDCREVTLEEIEGWSRGKKIANSASRLGSNIM